MANTRIKDISTAASTLNSDDFIAVDGNTAGTRKMAKADLITEVSTGVSGTYLEESNNLSDVASKDTSKLNLEVPDVGTAPNEVPLNGQLGSMAYQSADSVSVAELQVESTTGTGTTEALTVTDGTDTKFLVREDGRLGVNTASPAQDIHITGADPTIRLQDTSAGGSSEIEALNGSLVIGSDIGDAVAGSFIIFKVDGSETARIDSAGRLGVNQTSPTAQLQVDQPASDQSGAAAIKAVGTAYGTNKAFHGYMNTSSSTKSLLYLENGSGSVLDVKGDGTVALSGAIDFGSAATSAGQGTGTTGSVSNSVLSDYEYGSWTPSFATSGADFATINTEVVAAQYCKVGRVVHCQAYLRTDNVDATGASGTVVVDGLPFVSDTTADNFSTLNVGYSASWVNAPAAGYLQPNAAYVRLTRYSTTGASTITPSDLTAGASADKNTLIFSLSYIAST